MWNLESISSSLTLPLFLTAAWGMSNLHLSRHLDYRLPLARRYRISAIRKFWFWDLLFSFFAFVVLFYVLQGRLLVGLIAQESGFALDPRYQHLLHPVGAILFGLCWPTLTSISIKVGKKERVFSLEELRNRVLGGGLDTINIELREIVENYIRRVMESVEASDGNRELLLDRIGVSWGRPAQPTEEELRVLKKSLRERAAENLESIRATVAAVEMIPLIERRKPLMSVPGMTFREEMALFEQGVGFPCLLFGKAVTDFDGDRWRILRRNARALMVQRVTIIGSLTLIFMLLFAVNFLVGPPGSQGTPPVGKGSESPAVGADPTDFGDPSWSASRNRPSEARRNAP